MSRPAPSGELFVEVLELVREHTDGPEAAAKVLLIAATSMLAVFAGKNPDEVEAFVQQHLKETRVASGLFDALFGALYGPGRSGAV